MMLKKILYGYTIFHSSNRIQFYCSGCIFETQQDAENNFEHEWKDKNIPFNYYVCFENNREDILSIRNSRYYREERHEREREEREKLNKEDHSLKINEAPKIQFSD